MRDQTVTTITSPCIRNCCLDDRDICLGCLRSLDEICRWSSLDNPMRLQILMAVAERKKQRGLSSDSSGE